MPDRFSWKNATPEEWARESIRRNPDVKGPSIAQKTHSEPCVFCKTDVKANQEYLRTRGPSGESFHYKCLWAQLPADEAVAERERMESGVPLGESPIAKKPRKKSGPDLSGNMGRREPELKTPAAVPPAIDHEELTLADMNYKMGKLEGQLESKDLLNQKVEQMNSVLIDLLKRSNERSEDITMSVIKQLSQVK